MTDTARPTRGSRSGRPLMRLLDLLGRRWTLRILWELRSGPLTFRELRSACDEVSPSSLNARLKDLREARILALGEGGYGLSEEGAALLHELAGLNAWAARWAAPQASQQASQGAADGAAADSDWPPATGALSGAHNSGAHNSGARLPPGPRDPER